ncbi:MAG TPA: ABC transporter ATP-binding protein [Streptosporangiaceae bacterium]|nr:ABC transporter ATP-binding protein [Streptosporangiaceae bacterium]
MSLLSVEHVSHRYQSARDDRPVLQDVSVEIESGQDLAVVGESGCGKTTLGRLIAGLTRPAAGTVSFDGADIWQLRGAQYREYRQSVQLVHQDPYGALNPGLTVAETLAGGLRHQHIVPRREVRDEVLRLLGLAGLDTSRAFLERYPHQLSGGQRQRLVIARAMALRPSLLVADEPVSMLDVSMRLSILDLLKSLGRSHGLTYLFISHDFGVVRYFAAGGRIMVMFFGVVVESGPVEEVIARPRHPYTFLLLDAIPEPDPRRARRRRSDATRIAAERIEAYPAGTGCVFANRCPFVRDRCRAERPPSLPVAGASGHWSACWYPEDVPSPLLPAGGAAEKAGSSSLSGSPVPPAGGGPAVQAVDLAARPAAGEVG